MTRRLIAAVLLGGMAAYAWGAVSWLVLPWHTATLHRLPQERVTMEALATATADPGVYLFPYMPAGATAEAMKDFQARHERGPVGLLMIHPEGQDIMPPQKFAAGFLLNLAMSLLLTGLIWMSRKSIETYWGRVGLAALAGAAAAVAIDLQFWNWLMMPADFSVVNAIDHVLTFVIAGMAIAWPLSGPPPHSVPAANSAAPARNQPDGPVAVAGAMCTGRDRR